MKSRQIKYKKKEKKKKEENLRKRQEFIYHVRCNGRWNAVQMEGVCIIIGKEK